MPELSERDHRVLGQQLDLFHIEEDSPGNVFWHPKGYAIWRVIEDYIRETINRAGYMEVKTPQLLGANLFDQSGHSAKFGDSMFMWHEKIEGDDEATDQLALKPMNCPCHIQIFKQGTKSYRDLPLRMAEFGSCHRDESRGSLHGLMRLRGFTQDDAHIFCTAEQAEGEVIAFIKLLLEVYKQFGFDKVVCKLSTRPKERLGTEEMWDMMEQSLGRAVGASSVKYELAPGEGAFYGPKLEFVVEDTMGRPWQLGTIQCDFNLPERLGATYVGEDNKEHTPVMLHRAILGSLERFIGLLLEHHGGALPLWLSPVQITVLPISEKFNDYANEVLKIMQDASIRATADLRNDKIGAKIRDAQLQKVPYMFVVGAQEKAAGTVSIRNRKGENEVLAAELAMRKIIFEAMKETL